MSLAVENPLFGNEVDSGSRTSGAAHLCDPLDKVKFDGIELVTSLAMDRKPDKRAVPSSSTRILA
jgi:hypothetical protein